MSRAPYMPVFTDALLGDTLHLSSQEFGAYLLILFATWSNNGQALPDDDVNLARICRVSTRKWRSLLRPKVIGFFVVTDGLLHQKRLEKEWAYVAHRSEINQQNGKKGGRPRAQRGNQTVNRNETETISETKAPKPIPIKKEESKKDKRENHPHHPQQTSRARESARSATGRSPPGERDDEGEGEFDRFWKAYPRKANRGRAQKAFVIARQTQSFEQLLAAATRFAAENAGKPLNLVARPENWLADQRWLDDPLNATVPANTDFVPMPFESPNHWRHRMQIWFDEERGGPIPPNWPANWGPAPGQPNCRVPPDVIAEFGAPQCPIASKPGKHPSVSR